MYTGIAAVALCLLELAAQPQAEAEESIKVTVVGLIRTDVVAIGGETTGATITAKGITWELDFGKSAAFRKAAEKLNGKKGIVQGTLERRKGVEIRERWIVTVTAVEGVGRAGVGGDAALRFRATARRSDTRIRFVEGDAATIFDIASGFGIDQAVIERRLEEWPKTIRVRLRLNGLESFRATVGDVAVEWSMSSAPDAASRVSLRQGNEETPLEETSHLYTKAIWIGAEEKGGYFEIPLPAKLLEANPSKITLAWVDFYRG